LSTDVLSEHEKVSVVIPAKNSDKDIERCLKSVRAQTYRNIEIVVVDNYSTDNTVDIARKYADQVIISGPERSPQGNIGAKAATGDWIYLVGSDLVLEPEIASQAIAAAQAEGAGAVLVHNNSDPTVSRWARARAFERSMYVGDEVNVAARFVRRDLFLELGGFDESLIAGEDYDLHLRLLDRGVRIARIKASETHVGEPKTLREVMKKHYFYGSELRKYVAKHGKKTVKQLSPLRGAFLRNYKEFFKHPGDASLFVVYWSAKYAAGGLGWVFAGRGISNTKIYGESRSGSPAKS
jgi:glycosyltransferase involved in cell wall biosynthesis